MDLKIFSQLDFLPALKALFKDLKVPINYVADEPTTAKEILKDTHKDNDTFHLMEDVFFVGMVDDAAFEGNASPAVDKIKSDYDGILIFGVTLKDRTNGLLPTRSQLAEISRAFNREFYYTPVVVVFKYGNHIAFANTERLKFKQEWREGEKAGKVSLLKDINIQLPHRGHLDILKQLAITTTGSRAVRSYAQLYYYWQSVFSISVLNKNFYEDIITWFNEAVKDIEIPDHRAGSEKHKDFTVRLIARLIFIWFLKELKVIKEELLLPEFENGEENKLIKPKRKGTGYYKFILQNLFFNALNSEKKGRDKKVFDLYASNFEDEQAIKDAIFFSPYLNGGLFDIHTNDWCLLAPKTSQHIVNNAFSVPDHLFLDKETGLNSILSRYKFTIAENTPLEEEIAVDPEMLGRIFENLLAEQSDDTKEVARKNAGAFYTPRPVVSYMCRSTLLKHLDTEISPENSKTIIHKLLETTVLDPACGSGAFPMGMLEEMMQVLTTVDPEGKVWVAEMMKSKDEQFREHIAEMFADGQIRYVKKLGLLRSCLFGVDLLEYAIEITKLRCWLSLIVEQRVDFTKENYNLKPLPNLEFKFYKKNSLFRFYKDKNLNELIDQIDNNNLLKELVNLENQFFIAKNNRHGTKEEIKAKIVKLLERVVDSQIDNITKELNSVRSGINHLVYNRVAEKEIAKHRKKEKALAEELGNLVVFRDTIKDYFIERVVFPGIFNKENKNPGFDIVIGNPPYVNTKLISSMGISKKLEEEYGYCDDLYNHFTFRGLELLKKGGFLSYITSDTFLTLQTKKNIRMEFLGIPTVIKNGDGLFAEEKKVLPECQLIEIINTPKAFAALVDTAIFTVKKEISVDTPEMVYIDIRKPNADSFNISEEEWKQIRSSKENLSGWERILDRVFNALGHDKPNWTNAHTCDGDQVYKDSNSTLLKFKISFEPYRNSINYAIFSPTEYNCQILEKIIKPGKSVYDAWWPSINTSRDIRNNKPKIIGYTKNLNEGDITILGLVTDSAHGLTTGDNGGFVGVTQNSQIANRIAENRKKKLFKAIKSNQALLIEIEELSECYTQDVVDALLDSMKEQEIRNLFDKVKDVFGSRIFGKGLIYRIISEEECLYADQLSIGERESGINSKEEKYVPYDKGDREGNRWYIPTPYRIDWSKSGIQKMKSLSGNRWDGYEFFFREGFCMNNVLNPNSVYFKTRLKDATINDVASMSMYDEYGIGNIYYVITLNSYLFFKMLREFFNASVNIQINDLRKLPIKIPSENDLKAFNKKFDECLVVKNEYFAEEIDRAVMNGKLRPIEAEIDEMVNRLYGIEVKEEIELDELDEEVILPDEMEEDEE